MTDDRITPAARTDEPTVEPGRRTLLRLAGLAGAAGVVGTAPNDSLTGSTAGSAAASSIFELVPRQETTHRATSTGAWDEPGTWENGTVPGDDARVLIESGETVTVDHQDDARLRWLRVDGTLRFDPSSDTHLQVDTIVTTPNSRLEIGTESEPVQSDVTARITFIDSGPIDEDWDPNRLSRGLLTTGTVRAAGHRTVPFAELATFPQAGDSTLELAETPDGWEAGDRIVVPTVSLAGQITAEGGVSQNEQYEERQIASIAGKTVELDAALEHDHVPPKAELPAYVAHLDRNIRLESESGATKRRGHVLFAKQDVQWRDVGLYDLGRTDKSRAITDPHFGDPADHYETADPPANPHSRHPCQFHRTGLDTETTPGSVEHCVVWGSPGWGFVNRHSSVEMAENVSYEVLGAHFVAATGAEQGQFRHNIAMQASGSREGSAADPGGGSGTRRDIGDWGHRGHGFWLQGPGVDLVDNVAIGLYTSAYEYWGIGVPEPETVDDNSETDFSTQQARAAVPMYPASDANPTTVLRQLDPEQVPTAAVPIAGWTDNVAIASPHALRCQHHLDGETTDDLPYPEHSHIDGLTAYNVGGYADDEAKRAAIAVQNSRFLRFDNCHLVGGESQSRAFDGLPAPGTALERSRIEGFEVGLPVETAADWHVYDTELVDNETNVALAHAEGGVRLEQSTVGDGPPDDDRVYAASSSSGRLASQFESATHTDPYTVVSDDPAASGGAFLDNASALSSGTDEVPVDERVVLTLEDVPEGTYDVYVRVNGHTKIYVSDDGDRYRFDVQFNYLVDPDSTAQLPTDPAQWQTTGLSKGQSMGEFAWARLDTLTLAGSHELVLTNYWTEDVGLDALLLVEQGGVEPYWPTDVETATADDGSTCKSVPAAVAGEDGTIDDMELLQAFEHWRTGTAAQGTCEETISDQQLQTLLDTWQAQ